MPDTAAAVPALTGAAFFVNPYPAYAALRQHAAPVQDPATGTWLVARYADVDSLLRDARTSKNYQRAEPTSFELSVLFQDPPDHTRVRGVLNRAFSSRAVQSLEAELTRTADRLIDSFAAAGGGDFIAGFALPFPLSLISGLLGIPPADRDRLHGWSSVFIVEDADDPAVAGMAQMRAIGEMSSYFSELLRRRRAAAGDDLLSELIRAQTEDARLTDGQIVGNCILLMIAGHETTVNLLGNGLWLLLQRPDIVADLRRDPALWDGAIEEMLRFESPVQRSTYRLTTAPIAIAGQEIPAGASVGALIGAANRDAAVFDDAERFDIRRTPNRHIAFGAGPHFCVGGALARLEARIGFQRLFDRLPGLAPPKAPRPRLLQRWLGRATPPAVAPAWRANPVTRALHHLTVTW